MRIVPEHGVIEVGHVFFSHLLQKTAMVTEAHYLLMKEVFDVLGYRRYEWKCDCLNMPSRRAAKRLGFTFEGIFRQHIIYKNHNRDTAWFSIIFWLMIILMREANKSRNLIYLGKRVSRLIHWYFWLSVNGIKIGL